MLVGDTHQAGYAATGKASQGWAIDRSRALPVSNQDSHPAVRPGPDQHSMRGQAAVDDPVAVRVRHRLGNLPQQRELGSGRDLARLVGQPQVEPLELLVQRVHEADAEVVVHHVPGTQQPVVGQPRHDAVLVLGDLTHLCPGRGGGPGRGDEEPNPGPVGGRDAVKGGQSCQPSPSPSGSSSMTQEPASRWRRCTTPIRAIRAAMISSRLAPTDWLRGGRLQQPLGDPGQTGFALAAVQAEQVNPGRQAAVDTAVPDGAGTPPPERTARQSRGSGIVWPVSCAQWTSSSRSLLASRCALRRASLSGESSARCPSRRQVRSSPRKVPE